VSKTSVAIILGAIGVGIGIYMLTVAELRAADLLNLLP